MGDLVTEVSNRWLSLPVERDRHFMASKTISPHADEARVHGQVVS
jgi:hypothetical protein